MGTGQAGLAAAYILKQSGIQFMLLDKAKAIGDSRRNRYDSLQLITPRSYSRLPALSKIIWATGFRPDFSWIKINNLFSQRLMTKVTSLSLVIQ